MSQQSMIRADAEPASHHHPDPKRVGDRVFSGLATGSGVLILVILALVAAFLLIQGTPALLADPAKLTAQGYGPFAEWVAPYVFGTLWAAALALFLAVPVSIGIAPTFSGRVARSVPSIGGGSTGSAGRSCTGAAPPMSACRA